MWNSPCIYAAFLSSVLPRFHVFFDKRVFKNVLFYLWDFERCKTEKAGGANARTHVHTHTHTSQPAHLYFECVEIVSVVCKSHYQPSLHAISLSLHICSKSTHWHIKSGKPIGRYLFFATLRSYIRTVKREYSWSKKSEENGCWRIVW